MDRDRVPALTANQLIKVLQAAVRLDPANGEKTMISTSEAGCVREPIGEIAEITESTIVLKQAD